MDALTLADDSSTREFFWGIVVRRLILPILVALIAGLWTWLRYSRAKRKGDKSNQ